MIATSFVLVVRCYVISSWPASVPPFVPVSLSVPFSFPLPLSFALPFSVWFLVSLNSFLSSLSYKHRQRSANKPQKISTDKKNDGILFNTSHFLCSFCNHCRRIIWGQPSNQICLHIPVIRKTTANKKVIMNNVWWMTNGKFILVVVKTTEQLQMKKQNQKILPTLECKACF